MVDKFFDAVNVHNYTHGIHSRKRFQMPYTSSEDMRLKVYTHAHFSNSNSYPKFHLYPIVAEK